MFEYQGAYIQQLVDATDYPNFDIAAVNDTFLHWKHDKAENIMGYRDKSYRSLMTGTQSPPHHTPWLEALDDSMAAYLGDPASQRRA
jgi:trimethylamine monooxygenase